MVGSLVAFGFGWFENAVHLGKASAGSLMDAWNLRNSMAYLHVMFSLPMAFAIGLAALQSTLSRRIACIGLGWFLSALLHGLWNWEVLLGSTEFSVAPGFLSIKEWSLAIVPVAWLAIFWLDYRSLQGWGAPLAKWYARSGMRNQRSEIRRALRVRWAGKIHPKSSPQRA
ncbi:MAG: PrsW family glutamic-type intramembrane protease [Verrucomicrobiales bacterium]